MARLPRLTIPGFPHHVIQRGYDRRPIFVDDSDRERYLAALREAAGHIGASVHAYVLMPNHAHLILTPAAESTVGRVLQALARRYVGWFNARHRRTGALFEARYRSTVVDADRYLLACMRYVELNPVRAGLVDAPGGFPWSSHRHHIGVAVDPLITDHAVYWGLGNTPFERQAAYVRLFEPGPTEAELALIRRSTQGGWFIGAEQTAGSLPISRRATPLRAGRPRKI